MAALKAGKHVWLEKPMAETSLQARKLVDEARRREKVLFVDHTFVYTGAVRKMAEIIRSGDLGRVYYYDSVRVNLGLFQRDVSVISDLAVHDFSTPLGHAKHACDTIVPAMLVLRTTADTLEGHVADDLWSLATYQEMLFIK